jgi:autotransporter-associated beta strand protein
VTLATPVTLTAAGDAFDTGGGQIVVTAPISESQLSTAPMPVSLVKSGSGTLTLSATNTYSGGTCVEEGTMIVTQADALPTNTPVTIDSGMLVLSQKSTSWVNNPGARHNFSMLTVSGGGGGGTLDVKNNLVVVNYGTNSSPYADLAAAVNSGYIVQSTGEANRTVGIYDNGSAVLVGYACPGDTMLRGLVNSKDIGRILSAGKYGIGPSNARWDEGDFNHDGKVDSHDIGLILASGEYNAGTYDAAQMQPLSVISGLPSAARATLIYDPATGDLKIDPNGNTMTGFDLWDSAANFFVANAAFPPGGAFTTDDATEKFWSCFNPPNYLNAVWDLGDVAPAGLTEAQFTAALNNAAGDSVWYKSGGGTFDYNVNVVPEPSALALLAVGALSLLTRYRRKQAA